MVSCFCGGVKDQLLPMKEKHLIFFSESSTMVEYFDLKWGAVMKKIGYDNDLYIKTQSQHIRERIAQFGGKL